MFFIIGRNHTRVMLLYFLKDLLNKESFITTWISILANQRLIFIFIKRGQKLSMKSNINIFIYTINCYTIICLWICYLICLLLLLASIHKETLKVKFAPGGKRWFTSHDKSEYVIVSSFGILHQKHSVPHTTLSADLL